jgi:hypothetical protein
MDERYPIGKYEPQAYSREMKDQWLQDLRNLPDQLEYSILNLDEKQLDTPYRDGGWTIRQLIHHVADSHINAYVRAKLALTEDNPAIKTYDQEAWVKLDDVQSVPINISLTLLHALHTRWYAVLRNLPDDLWRRTVFHPEQKKNITLFDLLGSYAWHGKHHTAHIKRLRESRGW